MHLHDDDDILYNVNAKSQDQITLWLARTLTMFPYVSSHVSVTTNSKPTRLTIIIFKYVYVSGIMSHHIFLLISN